MKNCAMAATKLVTPKQTPTSRGCQAKRCWAQRAKVDSMPTRESSLADLATWTEESTSPIVTGSLLALDRYCPRPFR